ncbi:nuclease [Mangrovibacillus cuniculi]|uniref:Nuclease n=2 Tax=Mangrovibacillus cuniculi TaxID=2593652 RepID=A0A7S8CE47_9BACI|nr:nuclease [Mangrovibacillus cuniculi]
MIGIVITAWGIREWKASTRLQKKKTRSIVLIVLGITISLIGFATNGGDSTNDRKSEEVNFHNSTIEGPKGNVESEREAERKAQELIESPNLTERERQQLLDDLQLEAVTIDRVIDGDTVVTESGEKIRLIGVNSPESSNRIEEYGEKAKKYTTAMILGKEVFLQRDVSDRDRYDRQLRFIWLEIPKSVRNEQEIREHMFNADLLLNGYAEPSTFPPDVSYSKLFRKFAEEAREKEVGLWSIGPNGTTSGDFDQKAENGDFANCTELRKVYPNGVGKEHPSYNPKHDGDKDGWACE